ncbi:hypothetical protein HMPREF0262_02940 [Clostridium sp. ATCC 29733]|nr:hypothetical protein HMPREF0262_02940 [Clostridium sp. ATCC 29733]
MGALRRGERPRRGTPLFCAAGEDVPLPFPPPGCGQRLFCGVG